MTKGKLTSIGVVAAVMVVTAVLALAQGTVAQEKPCTDRARRGLAVNLARQVNTVQIRSFQQTNQYLAMTEFPSLNIAAGFTIQLMTNENRSQYVFSVKDAQDPCAFTVFSDQEQVIYTAQPLQ